MVHRCGTFLMPLLLSFDASPLRGDLFGSACGPTGPGLGLCSLSMPQVASGRPALGRLISALGLPVNMLQVINYDAARDLDTHVHRIGRTGRAGDKDGTAHTLLLPTQARPAAELVQCLAAAGQEVSQVRGCSGA